MPSAAELLAQARLLHRRLPALPEDVRPADAGAAYECQRGVVERLLAHYGGTPIGYKIACTNEIAQRALHVSSPFYGRMLAATTYTSGARLSAGQFFMRVMEAEFAFLMARDLPPGPAPRTRDEVAAAVEAVLPGIEVVDSRFEDWTTVGTPSLIADNACHGAWVRGEPVRDWRRIDLAAQTVALEINGRLVGAGAGAAVLGHPLNALAWLANTLNACGEGLKAGDYVTTGVTTDIYQASAGDRVRADFGAVGRVELSFE